MAYAGRTWRVLFNYDGITNGISFEAATALAPGYEDPQDDLEAVQDFVTEVRPVVQGWLTDQNSINTITGYSLVSTTAESLDFPDSP